MRKFGVFTSAVFLFALAAGCYGVLHDQITFSISSEYFTKFKYIQFGINPDDFGGHRIAVGIIGFLATWWVGMILGFAVGLVGLLFRDDKSMKAAMITSTFIIIFTAIVIAIFGYFYGKFYLVSNGVSWWLPENLTDKPGFIIVGSIHNFSYLGGALGLLLSLVYLIRKLISQSKGNY
ncbi:MAG: hypothetical protein KGZ74_19065 [Chitinophagaceae bacterium]|nr:hypothetical protein [Chitinophagaceae bacterium]